ncbi:cobyrinic acid ac-diamide synthase [Thiothrix nivea DSM 5205]|uniref:Cobyrinic acid ac-diamide synthase n=1 Tax=Thiothrix nivea (strain ATCC 35100 / DSM 5205 / JP2) TaxID=870187 RepID=A0A656HL66_THINJ|nr:cobyrinic acid ac-diamide synthase [Thiothrix nivea DSM 5205]
MKQSPVKSLVFLSQKGGSGKTTLSVHTAVTAQENGERVVVIDTDPQQSAMTWASARESDSPPVASISAAEIDKVLEAARQERMSLAVVDTAPHATPEASRIAQIADLIAIPVRPSAFDIAAAGNAVEIARAAGTKTVFVLSACPFRSPEIAETREVLAGYGLPIAPVDITERRAFARAVASGRAVTEFESDGKAAEEIRALWEWLKGQMA